VDYLPTNKQLADFLTKPLFYQSFVTNQQEASVFHFLLPNLVKSSTCPTWSIYIINPQAPLCNLMFEIRSSWISFCCTFIPPITWIFNKVRPVRLCCWVITRKTCPILRHTLHAHLFFGHNFCVLAPNDSKYV